jgi:thiol-disulfide isomerase/thioredoxin
MFLRLRYTVRIAVALLAVLLIPVAAAEFHPDALTLLRDVCKQYEDAESYHIEALAEHTSTSEFERNWFKDSLKAVIGSQGRYRFEVRSAMSTVVVVSDGKTVWRYHPHEHLYTAGSASSGTADENTRMAELGIERAKSLVNDLATLRSRIKSARLLGRQNVYLNGKKIRCIVLRYSSADLRFSKPDVREEETVWIDKSRNLIVRIKREAQYLFPDSQPQTTKMVLTFPVTELNTHQPEELFAFSPLPEDKLVASFPNALAPVTDTRTGEFLGKQSPDLRLQGSDGATVSLSVYRGKPIFIDFWAGWCAPCVDAMPQLKSLYSETAPKGLVWISVDGDDNPAEVDSFLAEQQIPWPNYHDTDGSLGKAFGRQGLPLGVLIDAEGKVTFYKAGYDVAELWTAISKLIPEIGSSSSSSAKGHSK